MYADVNILLADVVGSDISRKKRTMNEIGLEGGNVIAIRGENIFVCQFILFSLNENKPIRVINIMF